MTIAAAAITIPINSNERLLECSTSSCAIASVYANFDLKERWEIFSFCDAIGLSFLFVYGVCGYMQEMQCRDGDYHY
jgi:uncharacterized membrane protein YeiH